MIDNVLKIIVAGSRGFADYDNTFAPVLDTYLSDVGQLKYPPDSIEIVSGGARGADRMAERYAKERGLKFRLFPADWEAHGKAAGPIRNEQMAEYADWCIVFWDGESRGSKNMIKTAEKHSLRLNIFNYIERSITQTLEL